MRLGERRPTPPLPESRWLVACVRIPPGAPHQPACGPLPDVSRTFRWITSRFSNGTTYAFDLVAAGVSGDLAYTVGYERSSASVDSGPVEPNVLRVTHIYRREGGEWKIVHRDGDHLPIDQSPPAEAPTT
jgi:ketosteroid isomerase-like protein